MFVKSTRFKQVCQLLLSLIVASLAQIGELARRLDLHVLLADVHLRNRLSG